MSYPRNPLSDCGDTVHLSAVMEIPSGFSQGWPIRSEQYRKAMRASFNATLWPPQDDGFDNEDVLILRDGTKLASGGKAPGYSPVESRAHGNTRLP